MIELAISVILIQVFIVLSIFCLECCAVWFYHNVRLGISGNSYYFFSVGMKFRLFKEAFEGEMYRTYNFTASGRAFLESEDGEYLIAAIRLLLESAIARGGLDDDFRNSGLCSQMPNDPQSILVAFKDLFRSLSGFAHGKKIADAQRNDFIAIFERCIRLLYGWQHKYRDVFDRVRPFQTNLSIEKITEATEEFLLEKEHLEASSPERLPLGNIHSNMSKEKRIEIARLTPNPRWIFFKANYLPIADIFHYPKFYFCFSIAIPLLTTLIFGAMQAVDLSLAYWFSVYFCSLIPWPQLCRDIFGPNWMLFPFDFGYRLHAQFGIASLLCLCIFIYGVILKSESNELLDPAVMVALKVFSTFPLFLLASIGYEGVYLFASFFLCEDTCTNQNVIRKFHVFLALLHLWTLYELNAIGGSIAIASFGLATISRIYIYFITFRVAMLKSTRLIDVDLGMEVWPIPPKEESTPPEKELTEFKVTQSLSTALKSNQVMISQELWMYDYKNCLVLDLFVTPIYWETEIDLERGIIPTKRMTDTSRLLLREFPEGLNTKFCRLWPVQFCLSYWERINGLLQSCSCQGYEMRGHDKLHDQKVCLCRSREGYSMRSVLLYHINSKHPVICLVTELGFNSSLIIIKKFMMLVYDTPCAQLVLIADLSSQKSILTFGNSIFFYIEELCGNFIGLNSSLDDEAIISSLGKVFERIKIVLITKTLEVPEWAPEQYSIPNIICKDLKPSMARFPLRVRKYLIKQMRKFFADILHYTSLFDQISFRRYVLAQALKNNKSVDAGATMFAVCSTSEALILHSQFVETNGVQIVYLTEHDISSTVVKLTSMPTENCLRHVSL